MSPPFLATRALEATGLPLPAVVAIAAGAWLAYYLLACWLHPFPRHRRCGGTGHYVTPRSGRRATCKACGGNGRRLRFGRILWVYATRPRDL